MKTYFFIKTDSKFIKINFSEILYVEGCKNYVKIITDSRSYLVLITMRSMAELLPSSLFQRIHKSYIVSLDRVLEFNADTVFLKNKELPIGQLYKGVIEREVIIISDSLCWVSGIAIRGNNVRKFDKVG